jgi:hypothetical protein
MKALQKSLRQAVREWSKVDKSTIQFVAPYEQAHANVEPVKEANIATALGPRLDKAKLDEHSRLCVVGYDGATLVKKGYPWRRKIKKWLENGCSVDYFLTAPGVGVIKAISDISKKAPSGSGRLRMFQPKKNTRLSPKLISEIAQLKTFHFVVSEKPLTLWIETNHQTSEPKAFDCFFFPENAAKETGLGEIYLKRFKRVISEACDEVSLISRNSRTGKQKSRPYVNGRRVAL